MGPKWFPELLLELFNTTYGIILPTLSKQFRKVQGFTSTMFEFFWSISFSGGIDPFIFLANLFGFWLGGKRGAGQVGGGTDPSLPLIRKLTFCSVANW